jgi:hypothetical protein
VAAGHAELASDGGIVTDAGVAFLGRIGIDMAAMRAQRARKSGRVLCRPCLDWSERRPHLAGAVGAALAGRMLSLGWIERVRDTRALRVTRAGHLGLRDSFGLTLSGGGDEAAKRLAS